MRFRSCVYLKFCIAKFGCSVTEPDTWSYTMSLSISGLDGRGYQCEAILYNGIGVCEPTSHTPPFWHDIRTHFAYTSLLGTSIGEFPSLSLTCHPADFVSCQVPWWSYGYIFLLFSNSSSQGALEHGKMVSRDITRKGRRGARNQEAFKIGGNRLKRKWDFPGKVL